MFHSYKRLSFYILFLFPIYYIFPNAIYNYSDHIKFNFNPFILGIKESDGDILWNSDSNNHYYYGSIDRNGSMLIDKDDVKPIEVDADDSPLHITITPTQNIIGVLLPLIDDQLNQGVLNLETSLKVDVSLNVLGLLPVPLCSVTIPVSASTENSFEADINNDGDSSDPDETFGPAQYANGVAYIFGEGSISSDSLCTKYFTGFYIVLGIVPDPTIVGTGAYTNRVEIEPNDSSSTTNFLPYFSESFKGSTTTSNHDFFSFYLQPNQTIHLESVTSLFESGAYSNPLLSMSLKDSSNKVVASSYTIQEDDSRLNSDYFLKNLFRPCHNWECGGGGDTESEDEITGKVHTYLDYKSIKSQNQMFTLEVFTNQISNSPSYETSIEFSSISKLYENSSEDVMYYYNTPVEPNITEINGTLSEKESSDFYNFCLVANEEIKLKVSKSESISLSYATYYWGWEDSEEIIVSTVVNDSKTDTISWVNSFDRDWCFELEIYKKDSKKVNYTMKQQAVSNETSCQDGVDNDLDGKIDCNDSDCNGKICKVCEKQYICMNYDGAGNCYSGICKSVNNICSNYTCPVCEADPDCEF